MKRKKSTKIKAFIILYLILTLPQYAYAYIDPGSTTILLQILVAFIVGGLVSFRRNMASLFKRLINKLRKKN